MTTPLIRLIRSACPVVLALALLGPIDKLADVAATSIAQAQRAPVTSTISSATPASTIGECIGRLTRTTIWAGQPVSRRHFGVFNPSAPYRHGIDGIGPVYEARYGAGSGLKKGSVPGETVSLTFILEVFNNAPDSPCRLPNPYRFTDLDLEDAKMAAYGNDAWYYAWLMPRYRALSVTPTGPNECPPARPCPKCPTCIPDVPDRCLEVFIGPPGLPGQPGQRTIYRPGIESTGRIEVRLVPLASCPPPL